MSKTRILLFYFFLIFFNSIFSQEEKELSLFQEEIINKTDKFLEHTRFKKVRNFFLNKEWDSTLVYAAKELNTITDKRKELIQYYHFFKGFSFKEKKNFKAAKDELSFINQSLVFYLYVKSFLAEIALEENNFLKASIIFKEVEREWNDSIKGIEISNIKHNIGLCYLHLKNFKEAEKYLTNSIQLYEKQKDTVELVGVYGDIANLYYEQYKDDLAIPYFKKAYDFSKHVDNFTLKSNTAKNMAVVEENRKDLTAALKYRKEYEQWNDSLNNHNKIWELAQLEKKLAVEKKQNEVNVLKAENKAEIAQRNSFLYTAITLLALLFVITFYYRQNIKSKKTILDQKEQLDELNSTKDKLFSIVSHDLRSSVNTLKLSNKKVIKNLEKENIKEAHKLLQQNTNIVGSAYNLLDNLFNWALLQTKQSYFQIKEIHLFFAVEHVAYNYIPLIREKQLRFENSVSKTVKVLADQESLKIILRNLLDNAIKFSETNGKIKVYTENKGSLVSIIIEDTGVGIDNETRKKLLKKTISLEERKHKDVIGSGLGLQLCKSMIQKNNGTLSIISELGKGTKMIVSLSKPLSNE